MINDKFSVLLELGFSENTFSEVIAVTKLGSKWNCSPLGVKLNLKNRTLYFYVYEGAKILSFLKKQNIFTLNIVNEYSVFLNCVFKRSMEKEICKLTNTLGYIRVADAYIVCENSLPKQVGEGKYLVNAFVKEVVILRSKPRVFNRVLPAIVEALVHYTKIRPYAEIYGLTSSLELLEKIRHCKDTVYHASVDSKARNAIDFIYEEAVKLIDELKRG
ncbi:MAG: DUF447 family protein [Thermoprotei archaeon]|nr:DUF447 family protein [Thermoprotei archaeon]